ncbi:uncharacterized protein (DUF488 family) [Okibacterium sp. HSC-33S16]|uniref:DUF488 domain-containing protein n=1 Tax=Okibacterium sp. HSC-33S16 TaxID=2910965 RepID=UPI00209E8B60|nr:DUF488 domain-containing protein [Okibacterium sp. HSC-33S16]MCP2030749.1 uncharacterized protein (DUF488 family) [Okibacterium sp. HSC-33S16]
MQHVFTVGHSTHPFDEFVEMLSGHGVTLVADVRTVPKSRHNPQFAGDELQRTLPERSIGYQHLSALGGLRRPTRDSVNAGWNNSSFRGYADYMQTEQFSDGLAELIALTADDTVAIMCAEAVPWRCHRSLIGDALLVRDFEVDDIMSASSARPHTLTRFARADGLTLTYPPIDEEE